MDRASPLLPPAAPSAAVDPDPPPRPAGCPVPPRRPSDWTAYRRRWPCPPATVHRSRRLRAARGRRPAARPGASASSPALLLVVRGHLELQRQWCRGDLVLLEHDALDDEELRIVLKTLDEVAHAR